MQGKAGKVIKEGDIWNGICLVDVGSVRQTLSLALYIKTGI